MNFLFPSTLASLGAEDCRGIVAELLTQTTQIEVSIDRVDDLL